jgi:hypothetical protein
LLRLSKGERAAARSDPQQWGDQGLRHATSQC